MTFLGVHVYIITTGRTGGNNGVVGGLPNRMILYVLINSGDDTIAKCDYYN